jgi:hypothetical protein
MIFQIIVVFVMVGLLGLVLRWTFSRDKNAPVWPGEPSTRSTASEAAQRQSTETLTQPFPAGAVGHSAAEPEPAEDFGLLAAAAAVPSADEAERIRGVLAANGIRATTTIGRDGRHRVLVFASEVLRARRVAGS